MSDVSHLKAGDEIEAVFRDIEWGDDDWLEADWVDTGKQTIARGVLVERPSATGKPLFLESDHRCVRDSSGVSAGAWLERFELLKKGDS